MTYFANPNCSGQIKVEIGANRFFVGDGLTINRSRIPGSSTATFSLTLPASFLAPRRYTLAAVIGANGTKRFGGLFTSQNVEFLENGTQKKYNCTIEDFISYTRRLPIFGYKRTDTFIGHLQLLTQLGGAFSPSLTLNLITVAVISEASIPDPDSSYTPPVNPDSFEFEFVEGYLEDAYNQLAQLLGYSWEIMAGNWNSIGLLTSGTISIVRFRRNGVRGNPAPHPTIYAPSPTSVICPSDVFYSKLSLDVKFPEASSVLCLGFNGEERASNPAFPPVAEDIKPFRLFPIASSIDAETEFEYPENAKKITGFRITS